MRNHKRLLENVKDIKPILDELNNATWNQALGSSKYKDEYKSGKIQNNFKDAKSLYLIRKDGTSNVLWNQDFTNKNKEWFKDTKSLYLIRKDGRVSPAEPLFINTKKFLKQFINDFDGKLASVVFYKLKGKSGVGKHIDSGEYYEDKDRFHLVIKGRYRYTVNEVHPYLGKESVIYNEGELWWFNNKKPHESWNFTREERIILVFDVSQSNWRSKI